MRGIVQENALLKSKLASVKARHRSAEEDQLANQDALRRLTIDLEREQKTAARNVLDMENLKVVRTVL